MDVTISPIKSRLGPLKIRGLSVPSTSGERSPASQDALFLEENIGKCYNSQSVVRLRYQNLAIQHARMHGIGIET
ncbi:MAG: hypothetical protein CL912_02030 [Deltaproteobacteria bacterium]|nr:hypothetical protein [Deltaproteobacteria bacterium]